MPAFTIILLTKHRLVRADFHGRGQPHLVGLYEQARPDADDTGTLVDAALRLHSRRARRVWVLDSDFWTNVIGVPAASLAGLAADDMEPFLGFEAETLTGVSPLDTSLAYVPLAGSGAERRFWITQVSGISRSGIEDAVRELGGRLLGWAHPAGVPGALHERSHSAAAGGDSGASSSGECWERIEFWDDVIVCLRGPVAAPRGGAGVCPLDIVTVPRSTSTARLTEQIVAFRRQSPPDVRREVWDATGDGASRVLPDETPLHIGDTTPLRVWLEAWASQLAGARPPLPVLRPAPQPMSAPARAAVAACLASVVALGCFAHYQWQSRDAAALRGELERAQTPQKRLEAAKQEQSPLDKRRQELAKEVVQIEGDVAKVHTLNERGRSRVLRLLDSLAAQRQDELLVQQIAAQGGEVRISGLCLQVACANELAGRLQHDVEDLGWQVSPAEVTDSPARSVSGPWKFTIVVRETPKPVPTPASPPGGRARRTSGG